MAIYRYNKLVTRIVIRIHNGCLHWFTRTVPPKTHKWSSYQKQFKHFLKVNDIRTDSKQTLCWIAFIGTATNEVLESLTFPEKPANMKISTLFKTLSLHFEPKRLKIAERWRFWKYRQGPTQSLADYIIKVHKLRNLNVSVSLVFGCRCLIHGHWCCAFSSLPRWYRESNHTRSKTLTSKRTSYSQIEQEALALIYGAHKFHTYFWGWDFMLQTVHKPLTTIFGKKKGISSTTAGRLQRWALLLMGYSFSIEYKNITVFGMLMDFHDYQISISINRIMVTSMLLRWYRNLMTYM